MNFDISVVIPMFNASGTIIRALDSVKNQSVQVKEIIVIDDGSSDDSYSLVESYIKYNDLNIFIFKQENSGVSCARNKGISYSTGKYIAFLDSDDEWLPNKLELQIPYFSLEDVVLVGGYHRPTLKPQVVEYKEISVTDQFIKNSFQTSTVVVKKCIVDLFEGFYEAQKYAEEGRFYFDMLKFGKLIIVNQQVVIYDGGDKSGFGESGLSSNILEMQRGEISNFKYAKKLHNIGNLSFLFFILLSFIKYIRRFLLVKFFKFRKKHD